MDKFKTQTRRSGIDLLKTIAIIGVVIIHTCSMGYYQPIGSTSWIASLIWGGVARASVPIFLMCSGVLFFSPSKELSLKKLYLTYIPRIVIAMYVWALLYRVYALAEYDQLSLLNLYEALKHILLFQQEFHFYYLHIILLFYALVPVVRVFVRQASKQELKYALFIWFLVGILYPTIKSFWPFSLLTGIPTQWHLNMAFASVGYGLLGYYLHTYGLSPQLSVGAMLVGLGIVIGGTWGMSLNQGSVYLGFLDGMTLGPALLATGIFALSIHWKSQRPAVAHITTYLSKASFCIYLAHIFAIYLLADYGFNMLSFFPMVAIPLLAVVTLLLSCLVYAILSKIPVINRWLI